MIRLVLSALGLTALTVVIHGVGTMAATGRIDGRLTAQAQPTRFRIELLMAQLVGTLLLLHLAEAIVWGLFFRWVDALPDLESAAYFSLASYTTVGYGDVVVGKPWRILGPLEAAVGVLMLGWSTGVLVAAIGRVYRQLFPSLGTRS